MMPRVIGVLRSKDFWALFVWSTSMSTTMRLAAAGSFLAPSSWIWSLAPWTPSVVVRTARSSGLTTSFSVIPVPVTIGPRDITPKAPNSLIPSSMSSARRLRTATAFKARVNRQEKDAAGYRMEIERLQNEVAKFSKYQRHNEILSKGINDAFSMYKGTYQRMYNLWANPSDENKNAAALEMRSIRDILVKRCGDDQLPLVPPSLEVAPQEEEEEDEDEDEEDVAVLESSKDDK